MTSGQNESATPGRVKPPEETNRSLWTLPSVAWVILGIWILWVAFVFVYYQHIAHAAADYGDAFRLIDQLLIRWDGAHGLSDRLTLLFREYEALGHSHILTRVAWFLSETRSGFDFSIPGHIGRVSLVLAVGSAVFFIGWEGQKELGRKAWWSAALVLLVWIRLDDINTWTNNYTAFQYFYSAMGVGYLVAVGYFLVKRLSFGWLVAIGIPIAILGDAPGATALLGGVGVAGWWSLRRRTFEWRITAVLVPLGAAFLTGILLRSFSQPMGRGPAGEILNIDLAQWLSRSALHGLVNSGPAAWDRITQVVPISGAQDLVTTAIAISFLAGAAFLLLRARVESPVDLFAIGLLAFGLLAALGSYHLRGQNPLEVFSPRYLPWYVPATVGLVLLTANHLIRLGKTSGLIVLSACVGLLFAVRLFIGLPVLEARLSHYPEPWARLASYESGTLQTLSAHEQDWLMRRLSTYQRTDLVIAQRVLDWHTENVREEDFG